MAKKRNKRIIEDINFKFRKNTEIKADLVKVIDSAVGFLGVMPVKDALSLAQEKGLDLVEISPNSNPPVCKIIDWSKFKYEYSKKNKKLNTKTAQLKEMWFKPLTGKSDLERKIKKIIEFLEDKNKVKITIKPGKDRKLSKDLYFEQINNILDLLKDHCHIEVSPKLEGKNVYAIIKPKK